VLSFIVAAEEANGYIIPADINEVWWGIAGLVPILVLFFWKGLPAIKKALAKRSQGIADELANAEQTRRDAEAELASLRASLGNAEQESRRIVAEARERAGTLEADLIARYEAEAREAVQRARIEVEASKTQALADLREEVVGMTVQATEAILSETLDPSSQAQLVDRYIDQVGAAR
jgi:F-type H+-transporting ATPase subunit b